MNLAIVPMTEKRHLDRLTTEKLEAVILGECHNIRDLCENTAFIEGDWRTCKVGSPVYFWIKPRDIQEVRAVVARGTVVRYEAGVGAAVEFETEEFAWSIRFSRAAESGEPSLLFC